MPKLTLKDPGANFRSTTQIADNNTLIENAIENTLSRDGTGPNQMEANLDMNSNRVLNLPAPTSDSEPYRKVDIDSGIGPDITIVADNVADVSTVAGDISDVSTVADDLNGSDTIGAAASLVAAGSPGFISVASAGTANVRTLTSTGNGLTISNGNGASGNPSFALSQDIQSSASPAFAGLTITGDPVFDGVTVSLAGAVLGQSLGFPNSTSVAEPYTPAGAGDLLAAANETVTGDWTFEGALNLSAVTNLSSVRSDVISADTSLYFIADYGAAGDGSTDDSTEIAAALSAASGSTLLVSPNTYTAIRTNAGGPFTIPASTLIEGLGYGSGFEMDVNAVETVELFQLNPNVRIEGITFSVDSVASATCQIVRPGTGGQVISFSVFDGNATDAGGGSPTHVVQAIDFSQSTVDGFVSFCNEYTNLSRVFLKSNASTQSQTKLKFIGDRVSNFFSEAMAFNTPEASAEMQDVLVFGASFENGSKGNHCVGGASIKDARFIFNCLTGSGDEIAHFEENARRLVVVGNTVEFTNANTGSKWLDNNVSGTNDWPQYGAEALNVLGRANDDTDTIEGFTGNDIDLTAHDFADDDLVIYRTTGATAITGLEDGKLYYIVSSATDTVQLSTTSGGSAVSLSGSLPDGVHTIAPASQAFQYTNDGGDIPAEFIVHSENVAYGWTRALSIAPRMHNNWFESNIWHDNEYSVFAVRPTLSIRNNMSASARKADFEAQSGGLFGHVSFRRELASALTDSITGVSESADTITMTGHEFVNGEKVWYTYRDPSATGGNAIPGLTSSNSYYIINAAANTVQLALTPGGSAIALNASGGTTLPSGNHYLSRWDGHDAFISNPIKISGGSHYAGFSGWDLEIEDVIIPDMASGESWALLPIGHRLGGRLKVMLYSSASVFQTRVSDVKWDGSTFTDTNLTDLGSGAVDLFDIRHDGGNLCLRINNAVGSDLTHRVQVVFDGIHLFS